METKNFEAEEGALGITSNRKIEAEKDPLNLFNSVQTEEMMQFSLEVI
jgi:hypothetical protein